ncbi:zinc-dependent alcohol dehydrogenase family protein [Pirellulaceae bacterium SH449]
MKQIVHDRYGPPSIVAKCVELKELAPPSAWEVSVAVDAFPINPADLAMIQGRYGILNKPPCTVGMEGVGTVTHIGKSVSSVSVGDRVILLANNNWCTHRNVPATLVVKAPSTLDPHQLCMLKVSGLTALHLLTKFESLKPGSCVIQNAPLSAVGRYIIQLSKAMDVKTVNLVRRSEQIDAVTRLGGDIAILDDENTAEQIRKTLGKSMPKLAFDAVAGPSTNRLTQCLQDGGSIINYGMLSMTPCQLDSSDIIFRGIKLQGFWLSKVLNKISAAERHEQLTTLVGYLEKGVLHGAVDSLFSIENISNAIRRAEQEGRTGKVIVTPTNDHVIETTRQSS